MSSESNLIASGHEDRIQNLETAARETGAQVVELSTKVSYMQDQLDQVRTELGSKLDEVVARLDRLREEEHGQNERLTKLEEEKTTREQRVARWKKVGVAVFTTLAGAVGTKLVEWLLVSPPPGH
jgi:hypothetical protein